MATYQILCWQEIPSAVEARDAGGLKKLQLSQKFMALIDQAAMERDLTGSDAYLEQWNKSPRQEREGSAADVAAAVAKEIEDDFMNIRSKALKPKNA